MEKALCNCSALKELQDRKESPLFGVASIAAQPPLRRSSTYRFLQLRFSSKTKLMMKLTFLFLMTAFLSVHAAGVAQKVTLSVINAPLENVFNAVEKQTGHVFFFDDQVLKDAKRVSIRAHNMSLDDFLSAVLKPQSLRYSFQGKTIVISRASSPLSLRGEINVEATSSALNTLPPPIIITGRVSDENGNPIEGVSVRIKGSSKGTATNERGEFVLENVDEYAVLELSYVGFKTSEIPVNKRSQINVVMEENTSSLNQVVVVGYGTQSKREVSGSITNVSEKEFNRGVSRNAIDLLQGKVAGLTITKGSGDITNEQSIRLRGASSLTGSSQPFIVIDGVPGLSINAVSPQDIASISILKDASAAAIYGSRAASGVILITTKKGISARPVVEYEGYVAVDKVSNIPRVLTAQEWRDYTSSNHIDVGGIDLGGNTNWFKEIMRTGITHNHSLSLSGGGKNSSYRGSFSSLDQQGVVRDNSMQRYNARMMFNQKALNDRLDLTFTGAFTERNYSPTDTRNFILAYNMVPVAPVKNADGSWFDSREFDQGNPLRNIEYNKRRHKNSLYYGNMKAVLHITDDLAAGLNILKQRESDDYGEYNDAQTERGRDDQGNAKRESWTADKKLLEATLNYKKTFGESQVDVLGGYSYEANNYQNAGAQNRQFVTGFFGYNNIGTGENLRPTDVWSGANMNKLISFFGRVNYMLKDRYVLTGSVRRDGSSKFGANHKWGTFPSISAAWILSEESFLSQKDFLNVLKLRVGYGKSGNQEGVQPYQSLLLYSGSGQYYDNGNWYQSYSISQNANPDLKWEETSMFNVGVDFTLFDNRVSGTVEYYDKKTEDLLYTYNVPIPPYFIPTMIANVGAMSNKGIEAMVSVDVIRKNDFRWNISANLAHNTNKILSLSNDVFQTKSIKTGDAFIRGGSVNTTSIIEEGRDVGSFYMWVGKGLDASGNYIIDDMVDGVPGLTTEDRTYVGSAQPKLTYGFSNTFAYKGWDLNFFMRGVYGNDVLNYSRLAYATTQWLPGANVLHEALTLGLNENPKLNSFYIEKGSFLRLDNAAIAYNFDIKKSSLGIQRLRAYLSAQNLFVITKYNGVDPEVDMSGLAPGVEGRDYYPKSRTYSLGVNLGF